MPGFKDNHVRNQKGSNARVMPFKCNKSLYLSRFMDRCIYVDTGPLMLWQMRGLDIYNSYVHGYFPIQKMGWCSGLCQPGELGWYGSGDLHCLDLPLPTVHCANDVKYKGLLSPMNKIGNGWYESLITNGLPWRLPTYRDESDSLALWGFMVFCEGSEENLIST